MCGSHRCHSDPRLIMFPLCQLVDRNAIFGDDGEILGPLGKDSTGSCLFRFCVRLTRAERVQVGEAEVTGAVRAEGFLLMTLDDREC